MIQTEILTIHNFICFDMNLRYLIFVITTILITSCSSDEDDKTSDKQSDIIFDAHLNEFTGKSSLSPINEGVKATFFAFKSGEQTPVAQGNYYANKTGQMIGINNYIMYLLPENYNFYGISQNDTALFNPLDNFISNNLKNGVDYLWANINNQTLTGASTLLSITFNHIASQLYFEMESGNNVTINSVDSVLVQTPEENVKLNLFNSQLPQSDGFNTKFTPMTVSGLNSSFYILPVNTSVPLKTIFYLKINNQSNETLYALNISLPDGGYQSGKSYRYKLSISETEIIIKAFTVSDWIINDNTGTPIYPDDET